MQYREDRAADVMISWDVERGWPVGKCRLIIYLQKVGAALLTAGMALGCTNVAIVRSPETKENQVGFEIIILECILRGSQARKSAF